ncbi:hypothetical protein MAIC_39720 [Mycolicibacterium aichiense]|uniref:Uncharacterized protein n=1 Tax=Mycolicibacterium aichiense TaxID=1799 RepID=A0AAD1MEG4_9MYCO|nr:hypothetical protein MAIC_39720 [Mycolicibacterium aichiense]
MRDVAGEKPNGGRQVDHCAFGVHLLMQDVHHCYLVADFDETARKRGPDEAGTAGDEDGS